LLDWIFHVVDLAQAPILLLCAARPELREERPSWGKSSSRASLLDLQPLTGSDSDALMDNLLGGSGATPEVRTRVTAAAQGNPLFVEQIISMWIDDRTLTRDDGSWRLGTHAPTAIPPTISALLAARLDRLDQEDRTVIAGASVVGHVFYRGAVEELCPAVVRPKVPTSLSVLEVKQFIRGEASTFADQPTFAFRHILIRDAAYAAMLKRTRAELHERFASWLERVAGERVREYEEIVGYHLEQAHWFRRSLGPLGEREIALASRASQWLGSAGRRALSRGDVAAAVGLLDRAAAVDPDGTGRARLQLDLVDALQESGSVERAQVVVDEVAEWAKSTKDSALLSRALLLSFVLQLLNGPGPALEDVQREAQRAIALFTPTGDERGLAEAWMALTVVHWLRCHFASAAEATERAASHARRAGNTRLESVALGRHVIATQSGPAPVRDGILLCESVLRERGDLLVVRAWAIDALALFKAMEGAFDEAREHMRTARNILQDLGQMLTAGAQAMTFGAVELLADEPVAAEHGLRWGYDLLEAAGEKGFLSTTACWLARATYAQGRYERAERYTEVAESAAARGDIESQASWRGVRAKLCTRRKRFAQGVGLAEDSLRLADSTDYLNLRAEVRMDLGEALHMSGREEEATRSVEQALDLFEQKGNIVSAAKARKLLEEVTGSAPPRDG
jgi:tetratricopeptide (TPR) repeat protein